jgi:hypothetical protein
MAQMGADPTCMGPPKAASGPAGGQWGRRGRACWGARAPAPPLKPMLKVGYLKTANDSRFFNLCESVESVDRSPFLRHLRHLRLYAFMAMRGR